MPYESIVIWGCSFTFILIPQTDQLVKLNSKLLIALLCVPVSSALEKQFVSAGNGQVIEWRWKPKWCGESFGGAEWTELSVTSGDGAPHLRQTGSTSVSKSAVTYAARWGLRVPGNSGTRPAIKSYFAWNIQMRLIRTQPRGRFKWVPYLSGDGQVYKLIFFFFPRIKSEFTGPLRGSRLLHCSELGNLNKLFEGGGRLALEREREGREKGLGGSFCTKLYFCWKG